MNSPFSPTSPTSTPAGGVIDTAADPAHGLLESADRAAPMREVAHAAEARGRHSAHALGERAQHAREACAGHVRKHPLQTVLIAAGVGAALALLTRMLTVRGGAAD